MWLYIFIEVASYPRAVLPLLPGSVCPVSFSPLMFITLPSFPTLTHAHAKSTWFLGHKQILCLVLTHNTSQSVTHKHVLCYSTDIVLFVIWPSSDMSIWVVVPADFPLSSGCCDMINRSMSLEWLLVKMFCQQKLSSDFWWMWTLSWEHSTHLQSEGPLGLSFCICVREMSWHSLLCL